MRKIDIIAALVLLGLSALVVLDTWGLPYWTTFAPGPSFAAVWVGAIGAAIGATLLVSAVRTPDTGRADWPDVVGMRQVVLGAASLWLLLVLLPLFGTLLSGLLFMLLFLLGILRRPLLPSIFTSVVTVAMIEGVFVFWLNIKMPQGVVGF